jgi:hypothetical protein
VLQLAVSTHTREFEGRVCSAAPQAKVERGVRKNGGRGVWMRGGEKEKGEGA